MESLYYTPKTNIISHVNDTGIKILKRKRININNQGKRKKKGLKMGGTARLHPEVWGLHSSPCGICWNWNVQYGTFNGMTGTCTEMSGSWELKSITLSTQGSLKGSQTC